MSMKAKVVIFLMGLASAACGEIAVSWRGSAGFFFSASPGAGLLGNATGHATVAQLIYSVDLYADAAYINGATTGDDVIWDTLTLTEDGIPGNGDEWAAFVAYESRGFVDGYVYARIFQDSEIGVDDWYFYTPMLSLQDLAPLDLPQSLEMNTDLINGNAVDSGPTVSQVIPEPAAIGLIGLGGSIILTARRIRRRSAR